MSTLARSVNVDRASLAGAIGAVRERIAAAARRSGRDPAEITLDRGREGGAPECIRVAVEAGLTDLGENRVQEAELAIDAIGRRMARWHMIGHLQRNKASRAVERFDRIHGVDDEELARALSRQAETLELRLPVLIQINISKRGQQIRRRSGGGEPARSARGHHEGPRPRRADVDRRSGRASGRRARCVRVDARGARSRGARDRRGAARAVDGHERRFRDRGRGGQHDGSRRDRSLRGARLRTIEGPVTCLSLETWWARSQRSWISCCRRS